MEAMRNSWTDDRLDHLNHRVDEGFKLVGQRFEQVDHRFDRVEANAGELRVEMNTRFDRLESRFDAMQRTMIQVGAGLIGTLVVAVVAAIAAAN
jgi:hypothetical protein